MHYLVVIYLLKMRRPFKNTQAFREIKRILTSYYPEYKKLNKTKENPHRLAYLITLISSNEVKFIIRLKSRRMRYISPNYDKIRFRYPPKYYKYCTDE